MLNYWVMHWFFWVQYEYVGYPIDPFGRSEILYALSGCFFASLRLKKKQTRLENGARIYYVEVLLIRFLKLLKI